VSQKPIDKKVLNCDMNDKQRLLVMVGTGSLLVFIITIFGLGFSPVHRWLDTSEIDWEYEKSNVDFDNDKDWYKWAGELKKEKSVERTKVGFSSLFSKPTKQGEKTNWLGIIAIFNIAVSSVGFFLFKDK
tara:strand:- start:430 stop:819 length:390 start_codon:yes stop_codon:yes gene_type:complete